MEALKFVELRSYPVIFNQFQSLLTKNMKTTAENQEGWEIGSEVVRAEGYQPNRQRSRTGRQRSHNLAGRRATFSDLKGHLLKSKKNTKEHKTQIVMIMGHCAINRLWIALVAA
jgi:hypothetical protein